MDISCAFATALDTPNHIALAEQLGYKRAWCYDSPGLYPDVWMVLALAADRTSEIGLGPAVLVPSLRHPMTNAAAIAGLAHWAPGRVAVAIGAGFTGRMVFGHRAMRWTDVATYVRVLRALLHGEEAEWEGKVIRMLHHSTCAPPRPIDVPILIGADGPKGLAVAEEIGDDVFGAAVPPGSDRLDWRAMLTLGTVFDDGEDITSPRAKAALGAGAAVGLHWLFERGGAAAVDGLPAGRPWLDAIAQVPERSRHLAIHEGHLVAPNERDLLVLDDVISQMAALGLTGAPAEVRSRIDMLEQSGVTEIAYQPAGPDIERELRAFAAAAG
jgi:5,10-methylenetetrahydromethanopterin reductase